MISSLLAARRPQRYKFIMKHLVLGSLGVLAVSSGATASESAIRCTGRAVDFLAFPGSEPKAETSTLPEQIFIIDDVNNRVWRWLAPAEKRDQFCATKDCQSTFNPRSIDLFWFIPSEMFVSSVKFDLDRVTGHATHEIKMQRRGEIIYHYWDMVCEPTPLPQVRVPTKL